MKLVRKYQWKQEVLQPSTCGSTERTCASLQMHCTVGLCLTVTAHPVCIAAFFDPDGQPRPPLAHSHVYLPYSTNCHFLLYLLRRYIGSVCF